MHTSNISPLQVQVDRFHSITIAQETANLGELAVAVFLCIGKDNFILSIPFPAAVFFDLFHFCRRF